MGVPLFKSVGDDTVFSLIINKLASTQFQMKEFRDLIDLKRERLTALLKQLETPLRRNPEQVVDIRRITRPDNHLAYLIEQFIGTSRKYFIDIVLTTLAVVDCMHEIQIVSEQGFHISVIKDGIKANHVIDEPLPVFEGH